MSYRIVLASVSVYNNYIFSKYLHKLPSLGIGYIASILEKKGFSVRIIDRSIARMDLDNLINDILAFMPDIVGFSCVSENFLGSVELMKRLKNRSPNIITVVGGPHVYGLPRESIETQYIDFAFLGESEFAFLKLLESKFDPMNFSQIEGLIYKNNNDIKINSFVFPRNLDDVPFPARHLYGPLNQYRPSIITYKRLPATGIITSRGCPCRCTFCHSGKGDFKLRFHSPEYVIEEIKHLQKDFGIKEFYFLDDTFTANKARALRICEEIIRQKLNISWSCNVRVNYMSEELLRVMKKAGCWLLQIGVESGNQGVLDTIKKGITLEQVRTATQKAYQLGFLIKAFFIMGCPGETVGSLNETIQFMNSIPIHYASVNMMTPLPGTEIWDNVEKYGKFDKTRWDAINYLSDHPPFVPYGLTEDILLTKFKNAYIRFYTNPKVIGRNLLTLRSFGDLNRLITAGILLVKLGWSVAKKFLVENCFWEKYRSNIIFFALLVISCLSINHFWKEYSRCQLQRPFFEKPPFIKEITNPKMIIECSSGKLTCPNLLDQNPDTSWIAGELGFEKWFILDTMGKNKVDIIALLPNSSKLNGFLRKGKLFVSNDRKEWVFLQDIKVKKPPINRWYYWNLPGKNEFRYYKLLIPIGWEGGKFSTIADIKLLSRLFGCIITASGNYPNHPIELAFDGDLNTIWHSPSPPEDTLGWFILSYKNECQMLKYSIQIRSDTNLQAPKEFVVEASCADLPDKNSWKQISEERDLQWEKGETKSFTVSSPSFYKHYRVKIKSSIGGSFVSIAEFEPEFSESCHKMF